jgi:glycosyltransferase involved in cell wall biosynthesis
VPQPTAARPPADPDASRAPARLIAVIPAYQEAARIGGVVHGLLPFVDRVLVTDDGSQDDTAAVARAAGATVLVHSLNRGQGAALMTAITYALAQGATAIVTFDADGQHRAEDLPALTAPVLQGECDITLGSRFLQGNSAIPQGRRWLLRLATWYTRRSTGLAVTDTHNGLRCLSRTSALQVDLQLDRMAHASEILTWIAECKLNYREIAVAVRYSDETLAKGQRASGALRILYDLVLRHFW